jgi:HSP20 family protein
MTQQKFDPVKEFITLRDNISKTIGQSLKNAAGVIPEFPAVDVYETDNAVVVCTEPMPGLVPASIEVGMEDGVLTLSGETKLDREVPETAYLRRELHFGAFSRSIPIPSDVDPAAAKAALKADVLTITLPKRNQKSSQIINITPAE